MSAARKRPSPSSAALARAREILGPRAEVHDRGWRAPSAEDRAAASAELAERFPAGAIDALRPSANLSAMPDDLTLYHSRLAQEHFHRLEEAARNERSRLASIVHRARYRVGYISGVLPAFVIEGEGDTWEEALEEAARKRGAS